MSAARPATLFALGFRPFFLLVGVEGVALTLAWLAMLHGLFAVPRWLDPFATAARDLVEAGQPRANISREERTENVGRALAILDGDRDWFRPILDWRVGELDAAHKRLRALTKDQPLRILPHTPPDILGCFVLVPAARPS